MKNLKLFAMAMLASATMLTSCNKDDDDDDNPSVTPTYSIDDVTINGESYKQVVGTLNEDYTFSSSNKWVLSGGVFVGEGTTLTIEAGTMIFGADDGTTPFLAVERGAMINADGTANLPIVMTTIKEETGNAAPGDWGGLIINGYGKINVAGGEATGEGGTGTYGGDNNEDNSGTLRYVVVKYAGKILGSDNELNSFAFQGVGSGTTVEYIQAYRGSDDGLEFFGGSVNVRYAVSTGNQDDSFDWTQGWTGNGQFWVVEQNTDAGDRGIEADNNGDDNAATPFSEPMLSNLTLVGAEDGDSSNTGMRLRAGTKGYIYNAVVTGFSKYGVRVSDEAPSTQTYDNMMANELVVANSIVSNNGNNWRDCDPFSNDASNVVSDVSFLNNYIGTYSGAESFDPTTLGAWFVSGSYIGAVDAANNWTAGWTENL